ncbi:60S ribosome subunit biogenesis protein NOP8 [Wickerhamiella sorbophila]|uniref:60S ribosome subunit biogenesis protein NOP8 n=1 Tax=Wickerhamiella sorbophila TaxID=45607 RepID=A0A2T0FK11_9ASCO|nr:60S ribosome subunit biogenesis protein NOP8 [Wickerhamiella sorbophila]PRT55305.1 60S ribosome subunit biogenesis protein NOP8 [Wickerhamiella sorbophila]
MRIHIGQISEALAQDIGALEARLEKFGNLKSSIELRQKPCLDTYYGFVDIDLDQKHYGALRSGLNGMTFRQSKLTVQQARPDYKEVLEERNQKPAPGPNAEQLKRIRSKPYEIDVYPGRHRTAPRTSTKPTTFRVTLPGMDHPIKPRQKKIRLWGYEKRNLDSLVYEFVDGEWKDLLGNSVEIAGADEQQRNAKLAEQVQTTGVLSDSEFEEFVSKTTKLPDDENWYENDGIEIVSRENNTFVYNPLDASGDEGDEWPITQPTEEGAMEDALEATQEQLKENENTTEALRSVLSVSQPFTLFGGEAEQVEAEPMAVEPVAKKGKFGLFFAHSDSPFLRSQSQASKLFGSFDHEAWDKLFWEKRGEWNRALRRRRKEVARQMRKRAN